MWKKATNAFVFSSLGSTVIYLNIAKHRITQRQNMDKEILEAVAQALDGNGLIHYVKSEQKIEPTNIIDGDQIVHKVPVVLAGSETDEKEKIINNDEDHEVLIKNDVGPALPSVEIVNDSDSEEMYGFKSTFNEAPPIGSASPGDICVGSPGSPGYTKQ
eukprot:590858_1